MNKRVDPKRVVLGLMSRACPKCTHVQHVFFKTPKEFDEWECPECKRREKEDEDNVQE